MEAGLLNATFVANAAACSKRVVAHSRISTNQSRSAHYGRCHSGFGGGISSFRVAAGKSISCSAGGQLVKERVLPSYYEKNPPASFDEKDEGPKPNGTKVQGVSSSSEGLGIVGFLKGKNFLVTGATGFVGKVFIEKILRTEPEVGKLFLLIRGKGKSSPADRLKKEIINSELFRCLRDVHGDSYEAFMLSKLAPIDGDVVDDDLGMDAKVATDVRSMVDVIVNSAANTTFDERYDVAFNINTRGPYRLMKFAAMCTRLKLFLHVSTAFVNGQRQGSIAEKPFRLGDSIARERFVTSSSSSLLSSSLLTLDVEAELNSPVGRLRSNLQDKQETQRMKEFGLQMSRIYGWQNTCVFTKAMGEMAIDSIKGSVPVVIVRPSVVESTSAEPFPGWMQGSRMMDPVILYYGKGQISCFLANPEGVLDVVVNVNNEYYSSSIVIDLESESIPNELNEHHESGVNNEEQYAGLEDIEDHCSRQVIRSTDESKHNEVILKDREPVRVKGGTKRIESGINGKKIARICKTCKRPGHDSRTCLHSIKNVNRDLMNSEVNMKLIRRCKACGGSGHDKRNGINSQGICERAFAGELYTQEG